MLHATTNDRYTMKLNKRADKDWRNDLRKQKSFQFFSGKARLQRDESSSNSTSPPALQRFKPTQGQGKKPPLSLRAALAVIGGRAAGALSRRLHFGGGTSIVGVIAQRLYPEIVPYLARQLHYGSILITGTNGKTTTSSFMAAIINDAGLRVWRNREGSNLLRGIASSLVIRSQPNGRLRRSGRAIAVLEIDEAVLPTIVQHIPPRIIIFTNLFRDQLDRYGEVDSVLAHWQRAIAALSPDTTLVLNADDPATANLARSFAGNVVYYGIDTLHSTIHEPERGAQAQERHQTIDARTCPACGGDFVYDLRFYSHMGHYHCSTCGLQRPQPQVQATQVQELGFDRTRIHISTPTTEGEIVIPLPGFYNIYNALAAIAAAQALAIHWEPIVTGIEQSKPAFGRGERIQAEGRTIRLLLAKNPTGFNEVLRTLFTETTARNILFILNDHIADGQDISWIWDVDFERAVGHLNTLAVAGTRARDLALRLKYAGIELDEKDIIPPAPLRAARREDASTRAARKNASARARLSLVETQPQQPLVRKFGIKQALESALEQTPIGETLFIVPTYTGLLEVHRELEQRGLAPYYWEGRDA